MTIKENKNGHNKPHFLDFYAEFLYPDLYLTSKYEKIKKEITVLRVLRVSERTLNEIEDTFNGTITSERACIRASEYVEGHRNGQLGLA